MNQVNLKENHSIFIENFKKCFEDIRKKKTNLYKILDTTLETENQFKKIIKEYKPLDDNFFYNIKWKYKEYSESLASLSNLINGIKEDNDKINTLITYYENIRVNNNLNEICEPNNDVIDGLPGYQEFLEESDKKFYQLSDEIKHKEDIKSENKIIINLDYNYYSISFSCKSKFTNDYDFDSLIKELKNSFSNNKMCLSKIHKSIYANDIIKSDKFQNDSIISKYINECPKIFEINEIKLFKDYLINKCGISKDDLDYRGNGIYFNRSNNNKRGPEKYDPPYGCISLGLKSIGKYDNDDWLNNNSKSSEWAIAYHGVGNLSNLDQIRLMIYSIIKNGLRPGNSQDKFGREDKRHPQKKIKKGVYLYPTFKNAEHNSGIIIFNNKKYKIILMARVLIEKISEPEDAEQWILEEKYIRVYRILAKKID